jgi:SAM-dependent methyltransferase
VLRASVERWPLSLTRVLDLACGSGEATLALRALGAQQIDGIDPFTGAAYLARTGQAAEPFDFAAIAAGALSGRAYSLVVCSFAMHLAEASRLPSLAYRMAEIAPQLLILTPHKRPVLKPEWGWQLREEFVRDRVRARLYDRFVALPAGL